MTRLEATYSRTSVIAWPSATVGSHTYLQGMQLDLSERYNVIIYHLDCIANTVIIEKSRTLKANGSNKSLN